MTFKDRMRSAWDGLRQVVRSPIPSDLLSSYVYGYSYGTPNAEKLRPGFDQFATFGYGGNAVVFGLIRRRIELFSEATFKWRKLSDKKLFGNADLSKLEFPWR